MLSGVSNFNNSHDIRTMTLFSVLVSTIVLSSWFLCSFQDVDGGSNVLHDSKLASFTLRILPNVPSESLVIVEVIDC